MHPIASLQAALVTALEGDGALTALIGAGGVFDAPPRSRPAPYVVIDRHDVRQRDGDLAPGQEHRVLLHCWSDQPSRQAALEIAERVVAVGLGVAPVGHRALDGLSIGFRTLKASRQGGNRLLHEIDLYEVSIVTFPMMEDARIAAPLTAGAAIAAATRTIRNR